MTNVITFPKPKQKHKPSYHLIEHDGSPRQELWTPFAFGVSMLIWATGMAPPEPPPPTGGSTAANREGALLIMAA